MENVYREANNQRVPVPTKDNLDFWKHIWPVLYSASSMSWTYDSARQGHGQSRIQSNMKVLLRSE